MAPLPCIFRECGPKRADNYIFVDFMTNKLEVDTNEKHLVVKLHRDKKVVT